MIIVFGSINVDYAVRVVRFPAPGQTIHSPSYELYAGGKGANQALACARSGVKTALVGKVGDDAMATKILNNLRRNEVITSGVAVSDVLPTGVAFVTTDSKGENQIVVCAGANGDVSATQIPDEVLKEGNVLVLQMEVPIEENLTLMRRAKEKGVKIVLNLAPAYHISQKALEMVDYLIVNESEAHIIAEIVGIGVSQDYLLLAKALAAKSGHTCVVTLGENGAVACDADGKGWRVPAHPVEVVDTTGAGDCFCGTFAAAIHSKFALGTALRRANVAAGLSCTKDGAQESYPYIADIEAVLENFPQAVSC
jgi:ribokinase